jgi:hypothetical protein
MWIADWARGGIMYPRITRMLQQLRAARIEITSVLWQQDEGKGSPADPDTEGYRNDFLAFAQTIRSSGFATPVYVARNLLCAELRQMKLYGLYSWGWSMTG